MRGRGRLARLVAAAMRFPPGGAVPLHVAFAEQDGVERWTRDFGGHRFSSELSGKGGLLQERFGAIRFVFALPSAPDGLEMQLKRWSVLGIPLPLFLAPRIAAREYEEAGRFRFDVRVAMPLVGEVIQLFAAGCCRRARVRRFGRRSASRSWRRPWRDPRPSQAAPQCSERLPARFSFPLPCSPS